MKATYTKGQLRIEAGLAVIPVRRSRPAAALVLDDAQARRLVKDLTAFLNGRYGQSRYDAEVANGGELERLPDGSRPGDHWSGGVE